MEYTGLALICLFVATAYGIPEWELFDLEDPAETREGINYRLPNHTVPISYVVELIPFITDNNFTFNGWVSILVSVNARTNSIALHTYEITIDDVAVTTGDTNVGVKNTTYDADLQFFTIHFDSDLNIANYTIDIMYRGVLSETMAGFYRSYYIDDSGKKSWIATTQFEPGSARRAFPCFDEPALKATFDISIAHFPNMTAVSNMPNVSISAPDPVVDNRVWTTFETTPVMSTYLVAFVVSDFKHVSSKNGRVRVWSRPNAIHATEYSLAIAEKELEVLSTYTNFHYHDALPKIDHFAIPDFSAGAMENWGLLTYREQALLWIDGKSTTGNKQTVATIIAHELAHQWFGNLVGPVWWSHVWLNEGFAAYFEYYIVSLINADWGIMDHRFTISNYHTAFIVDSTDSSHPLIHYVDSRNGVSSLFDTVTYQKGASVLRMLSHILSENKFRDGLRLYLKTKAYSNATSDELWEALETVSSWLVTNLPINLHIKEVADTWTRQKGYPLITVNRNYDAKTQEITQERFLLNGRGSSNDTKQYRWWVPINFATESSLNFSNTQTTDWIRDRDDSIVIDGFDSTDWIICNKQQTGYYRVNYDEKNWQLITDYLRSPNYINIHVSNRAQLIDDSLNLARSGYLKYEVALSLTTYLTQEEEYAPWAAFFVAISHLQRMLGHSNAYENFNTYVHHLVHPLQNKLTHEVIHGESHLSKFNRLNALSWACAMGNVQCVSEAERLLLEYFNSDDPENHPISPDLKSWFYCEGLRNANASVWKFMLERYYTSELANEKVLILSNLGCSQNKDILFDYMKLPIQNDTEIRIQDRGSVFSSVYTSSSSNVDVAFDFLVQHYDDIVKSYNGRSFVNQILSGVAGRMTSEEQLTKLKEFVANKSNILGSSLSTATGAIKTVENNIAWLKKYEDDISTWLKDEVKLYGNSAVSFTTSTVLAVLTFTVFKIL